MKTLIVYGTKYGSVKKCIEVLKQSLQGEVEVCHLKECKVKSIDEYQNIIIGASVYMGRIQKSVRRFITKFLNELLIKRVGLFTCCMAQGEGALNQLKKVYPNELVKKAVVMDYFGGEIIYHKMKPFHRFVVNMVSKADQKENQDFPKLDENKSASFFRDEEIKTFASIINQGG